MNIAVILSGGIGSRMGLDIPKQYVLVKNQPIINYCLKTFIEHDKIDIIVITVANEWKCFVEEHLSRLAPKKPIYFAKPGKTRQYSIFNALNTINATNNNDDLVIIHDAARPLVSNLLITKSLLACKNADGIMPVIPVKDTIYLSDDGHNIKQLLNRNYLWAGQAPETFRFYKYLEAHNQLSEDELLKINGSTELAYKCGLNCQMIEGDPLNFKITTLEDLSNFKSIIESYNDENNESICTPWNK